MRKNAKLFKNNNKNIKNRLKVAVIILNYNNWKNTIECLESVLRNDYSNYQVIVVDNSSLNNSIKMYKNIGRRRQKVLTPDPTYPLYYLSYPPVKKPISIFITQEKKQKKKVVNFELEEKNTD